MSLAAKIVVIAAIVALAWKYPLIGGLTLSFAYVATVIANRRRRD